MPTLKEVQEWLSGQGFTVPPFVVALWMELLQARLDCMQEAGYSSDVIKLAMLHGLALFGLSSGNRYINSQSAPSGAARSFHTKNLTEAWLGNKNMLRTLDPAGCLDSVLPEEPALKKRAALFVGRGGCHHE